MEVSKLSHIPKEDRARIEKLLSFLVWDEAFAYVLFGNKPMSRVSQPRKLSSYYLEVYQSPLFELESLWETWEKYAYWFPMREFVFLTENDENLFTIYLLNKTNCLEVIEGNLALFQEKTGCNLNSSEMFDYVFTSDDVFKKGLNKSQALTGMLFGYGTGNAVGYENHFSVNRCPVPPECTDTEGDTEDSCLLFIPGFVSFSAEETRNLMADYRQQRQEILKM
jgi:hypothetical protein